MGSVEGSKALGGQRGTNSSSRFIHTWRYNSPLVQVGLICFCISGMFNALNGLGEPMPRSRRHGRRQRGPGCHLRLVLSPCWGCSAGVGAAFLWAVQGVIMVSYPEDENKGKYIGMCWSIFNTGAVLGSLIPLVIAAAIPPFPPPPIGAFIVIMPIGSLLSLTLLPPRKICVNVIISEVNFL